ncbi:MAG TPA: hypothetical protein VMC78_03475 [Mycobacterium sp.]|nr:hypothetical protein [Mycobacterium sp.]
MAAQKNSPISDLYVVDTFADLGHDTNPVAAQHMWRIWIHRIGIPSLGQHPIGGIEGRVLNVQHNLTLARYRI